MPAFRTAFQGYAVKFSPFEEGKLAVATSQNFGIIGNGKQYVLQVSAARRPARRRRRLHSNVQRPTRPLPAHSPPPPPATTR
jgi:hypothetical protein